MSAKSEWGGMCCSTDGDKAACRSWFMGMIDDHDVLKAEILEDIVTGKTKKIRAVVRHADGSIRVATRTMGANFTVRVAPASKSVAKEFAS